jgi:Flp pilus assembly protein TadB
MAGLLGVTVIGVVLAAREHAVARTGSTALTAFLDGYRLGLLLAGALVAAGGLVAWLVLRRNALRRTAPLSTPVPETPPVTVGAEA